MSININNAPVYTGFFKKKVILEEVDEVDEEEHIDVDYSEFDYEFDNFMDLTDRFNYDNPEIFDIYGRCPVSYIEFYEVLKDGYHVHRRNWNMELHIEDYINKCISVVFDDADFVSNQRHEFVSYLYDKLCLQS